MQARAAAAAAASLLVVVWSAAGCGHRSPAFPASKPGGGADAPYLDPARPPEERAADLVARLTLAEKVAQTMTDAPAIPRLGVPAYGWWNEALHGVARAGSATVFPQAIGLAATFDERLMYRVGEAISSEARAKYNEAQRRGERGTYHGLTFFSPNLNIFRDPRWGRGQETYGEDPLLTARMGVAFIRAMQGDDPHFLKTATTAKHFAVHSGPEATRHEFDARVSEHDLEDTYLPQFEAAVRDGHVASVMAAYNRVNGKPCAANPALLQRTLRDRWGFDGFVVGDCGAVSDILRGHKTAATPELAAAMALTAGTDLDCGEAFRALEPAAALGLISEGAIDRAVRRLFTVRFRLGLFDSPARVVWSSTPLSVVDAPAHRQLARDAAAESLVLLENHGGALPLGPGTRRLAVVGPTADDLDVLVGNYAGTPAHPVTILAGIRARARAAHVAVTYARGAAVAGSGGSTAQLREAVAAAHHADTVVAVLGLTPHYEGEEGENPENPSGDRVSLGLPSGQERLLEAVVATGRPVIVVLTGGSALGIPWATDHARAILAAWYPGEEGGTAVAAALFGDASPAGRLPVTVYRSAVDLPPFDDYAMRGRTYRYFTRPALYPFGHGLSYTTFRYANLTLTPATVEAGQDAAATVEVENVGRRAADEVVEAYVIPRAVPPYAPHRWLAAFARVTLAPGARATVHLPLPVRGLSLVDDRGRRRVVPGLVEIAVGGGQPDRSGNYGGETHGVTATLTITGAAVELK
jgi:beta-glucosidase